uniref:Aspartate transaminase n=1 Tax=Gongylonema pulchrum TaxID=637853 RepID=A0A183EX40_9BILA
LAKYQTQFYKFLGEAATISRNATSILPRAFVPLRSIPAADLGHSILADANKDGSFKLLQQGNMLSPRAVLAAKVISTVFKDSSGLMW